MSKIDTHHHYNPPPYLKALEDAGAGDPSGWPTPFWSLNASSNIMKSVGIRTAILSVTTPGLDFLPQGERQRKLAREINEYGAELKRADPETIGFFATVPTLLDVEGAIAEIRYALEELDADGICLFSRYGDGPLYLGQEKFKPVWTELNAQKAVVFIHPTYPADKRLSNPGLPNGVIDYPHETSRTAMDLILSNRKRENPNCKVILSHAGGTLPFIVSRVAELCPLLPPSFRKYPKTTEEIHEDAKSFYVDLALSTYKIPLTATIDYFGADHIFYGSDFPYADAKGVKSFSKMLDEYGLDEEVEKKIHFKNAERLFPRLKSKKSQVRGNGLVM